MLFCRHMPKAFRLSVLLLTKISTLLFLHKRDSLRTFRRRVTSVLLMLFPKLKLMLKKSLRRKKQGRRPRKKLKSWKNKLNGRKKRICRNGTRQRKQPLKKQSKSYLIRIRLFWRVWTVSGKRMILLKLKRQLPNGAI